MNRPVKHGNGWRIRWTDATGRRRSETYASKFDAAFALRRHELEVAETKRGLRDLRPLDRTFAEACNYWLKHRVPEKKSGKDDVYVIERYLRRALGTVLLRDFGREHIDSYLGALPPHLKPRTRNNHLSLISGILTVAVDLRWIGSRPRIAKNRVSPADEGWLKNADELKRLLIIARAQEGEAVFTLYAAAIYTGMRSGELAGLRWDDVDFSRGFITVQRSFATSTKSCKVRRVPIMNCLRPLL